MFVGRANEGVVELDMEDMLKHMAVIGGGKQDPISKKYIATLLGDQIKAKQGGMIIQMDTDDFIKNIQNKLKAAHRENDFIELTEQDADNLVELIYQAVDANQFIYLKLSDKSQEFIQCFNKAMDTYLDYTCITLKRRRNGRSPFLVVINQVEQNMCPLWIKFSLWFRKINFMLICSFEGYDSIEATKEDKDKFYNINCLIDSMHTKVLFSQSSHAENDGFAAFIGLPRNLKATGWYGFLGTGKERESLLSRLGRKEAVVFIQHDYYKVAW